MHFLPLCAQDNGPEFTLSKTLADCKKLKRVNLTKLQLDGGSSGVAEQIKKLCLGVKDGIFWGTDGARLP